MVLVVVVVVVVSVGCRRVERGSVGGNGVTQDQLSAKETGCQSPPIRKRQAVYQRHLRSRPHGHQAPKRGGRNKREGGHRTINTTIYKKKIEPCGRSWAFSDV